MIQARHHGSSSSMSACRNSASAHALLHTCFKNVGFVVQ
jgi:hypothetical protein